MKSKKSCHRLPIQSSPYSHLYSNISFESMWADYVFTLGSNTVGIYIKVKKMSIRTIHYSLSWQRGEGVAAAQPIDNRFWPSIWWLESLFTQVCGDVWANSAMNASVVSSLIIDEALTNIMPHKDTLFYRLSSTQS